MISALGTNVSRLLTDYLEQLRRRVETHNQVNSRRIPQETPYAMGKFAERVAAVTMGWSDSAGCQNFLSAESVPRLGTSVSVERSHAPTNICNALICGALLGQERLGTSSG
jgi:hypothetical protein